MKAIIILLATLFMTACSGEHIVVKPSPDADSVRSQRMFVVSHGWHTGIVIPAQDLNLSIPELRERFGDVAYYEIGWGDNGFYQSQEITAGLTLQAMFWSQGAVIHIVAVPDSPKDYFSKSEVIDTCLTDKEAASIRSYIANSFAHDANGRVTRRAQGIYGDSQFYDGKGRFSLLNTCNAWTAKGLENAGLDISPEFNLTAGSVMEYLRANRKECTATKKFGLEQKVHH